MIGSLGIVIGNSTESVSNTSAFQNEGNRIITEVCLGKYCVDYQIAVVLVTMFCLIIFVTLYRINKGGQS